MTMGLAEWIIDDTCLVFFVIGTEKSLNIDDEYEDRSEEEEEKC